MNYFGHLRLICSLYPNLWSVLKEFNVCDQSKIFQHMLIREIAYKNYYYGEKVFKTLNSLVVNLLGSNYQQKYVEIIDLINRVYPNRNLKGKKINKSKVTRYFTMRSFEKFYLYNVVLIPNNDIDLDDYNNKFDTKTISSSTLQQNIISFFNDDYIPLIDKEDIYSYLFTGGMGIIWITKYDLENKYIKQGNQHYYALGLYEQSKDYYVVFHFNKNDIDSHSIYIPTLSEKPSDEIGIFRPAKRSDKWGETVKSNNLTTGEPEGVLPKFEIKNAFNYYLVFVDTPTVFDSRHYRNYIQLSKQSI